LDRSGTRWRESGEKCITRSFVICTGCGRNNSHISKNRCGVPKADRGVWSIPLGWVHHKVFNCRHAVGGWASRICSGGFLQTWRICNCDAEGV
jgi:hypothetical protein